nr:peptidoglycan recognition family protein [uncultured Faecalimonas sp.]
MKYKRIEHCSRQRKKRRMLIRAGVILVLVLGVAFGAMKACKTAFFGGGKKLSEEELEKRKPDIDVQLLTVNEYSRPGTEVEKIRGIVIHYTANPGSTAQNNRDYFEGLKDSHETSVSSHFVVGLEGEIIQCVPTWEMAYASNSRNVDTVSIECCHPDESGKFNRKTYRSVVELTAWLCQKFGLTEEDVIRHYDVTGKACPLYYVEHEKKWEEFKEDVKKAMR